MTRTTKADDSQAEFWQALALWAFAAGMLAGFLTAGTGPLFPEGAHP